MTKIIIILTTKAFIFGWIRRIEWDSRNGSQNNSSQTKAIFLAKQPRNRPPYMLLMPSSANDGHRQESDSSWCGIANDIRVYNKCTNPTVATHIWDTHLRMTLRLQESSFHRQIVFHCQGNGSLDNCYLKQSLGVQLSGIMPWSMLDGKVTKTAFIADVDLSELSCNL
jgi:hypothetical protein